MPHLQAAARARRLSQEGRAVEIFFFFGRKGRAAGSYPAPEYPLIIEPFAGSMAYSLHWRPRFAIGVEADPRVAALWWRLCEMSEQELRDYPLPAIGDTTTDPWVLFAANSAFSSLSKSRTINEFLRQRFAAQQRMGLRHHAYARRSVLYHHGDYREAPDVEATWYIDPPYEGVLKGGYRHQAIDYEELAEWCMTRRGQVVVCEGPDGSWLPFRDHGRWRGVPMFGRQAKPVVEKVLVTQTHRRCAQCHVTFPASRSDAKYCSARCRQARSRARRKSAKTG